MKTTVRFLRHAGVYRPMCDLFESLTRSAAFRSGPGQTFRTHRKLLRPTHRRDEPRPAIPQRVARQHCPSLLHRHAHPKSVPGSGTINLQRTVNSVLTVCLSPGDNPILIPASATIDREAGVAGSVWNSLCAQTTIEPVWSQSREFAMRRAAQIQDRPTPLPAV
jgi:hypothetical protein